MKLHLFTIIIFFLLVIYSANIFTVKAGEVNTIELLTQQIKAQKGQVIYVDFWASWCIPCRKSFPWMNELQSKYKAQGLQIISINLDHNKALADKFLEKNPVNFPIIYDPKGSISRKYKLKGMPSSFIINKDGQVISKHTGFNNEKSLAYEQEIIHLLNN